MTLHRHTSLEDTARRRDRQLTVAEADLERAVAAAIQDLLGQMRERITPSLRAELTASNNVSSMFTLGEVNRWWAQALDDDGVLGTVQRLWREGRADTSDATMTRRSLDSVGEYLGRVKDRLSRTATPTLPEQAFDRVRVGMADEMARGSDKATTARRLAADLEWQGEDVPFWESRLDQVNGQLDAVLDAYGPKGDPGREYARLHDPQVAELQRDRSQMIRRLDDDRSTWEMRATRIARTESTGAYNAGTRTALQEEGAGVKKWVSTLDERTRFEHLDAHGQCVPLNDPFDVGGTMLEMPGDPSGPAGLIINCRCTHIGARTCDELPVPMETDPVSKYQDPVTIDELREQAGLEPLDREQEAEQQAVAEAADPDLATEESDESVDIAPELGEELLDEMSDAEFDELFGDPDDIGTVPEPAPSEEEIAVADWLGIDPAEVTADDIAQAQMDNPALMSPADYEAIFGEPHPDTEVTEPELPPSPEGILSEDDLDPPPESLGELVDPPQPTPGQGATSAQIDAMNADEFADYMQTGAIPGVTAPPEPDLPTDDVALPDARTFDPEDTQRAYEWGTRHYQPETDPQVREGIEEYRQDAAVINTELRFPGSTEQSLGPDEAAMVEEWVAGIDQAMADQPVPEPVRVYRGIDAGTVEMLSGGEGDLVGAQFTDDGFMSTSLDPKVADNFRQRHEGATFEITVPAGTKGVMVDAVGDIDPFEFAESELLLGRGTELRVVGRREVHGRVVHVAEVVAQHE